MIGAQCIQCDRGGRWDNQVWNSERDEYGICVYDSSVLIDEDKFIYALEKFLTSTRAEAKLNQ